MKLSSVKKVIYLFLQYNEKMNLHIPDILATFPVDHEDKLWLNDLAPANIYDIDTADDVFHCPISSLKSPALIFRSIAKV